VEVLEQPRAALHGFTRATTLPTTDVNFGTLTQVTTPVAKNMDHDHAYLRAGLGQLWS
jgi:hypothetical protein